MIPGWSLHEVYEGLHGQPRAALVDPAGRVHHVDVSGQDSLRDAAAWLLRLKDGPRDDAYRAQKDDAWEALRSALNEQ